MKAADVLIAWTPAQGAGADIHKRFAATAGSVAILAWPQDRESADAYARRFGGHDEDWKAASDDAIVNQLRVLARTLAIRDGIDAEAVLAGFLQIDEYRREVFREHAVSLGPQARSRASVAALRCVA